MAAITVRNLPEETHRALKARAKKHGRSTEAEVRAILTAAAKPDDEPRLGTLLSQIGTEAGGLELPARVRVDGEPIDLS